MTLSNEINDDDKINDTKLTNLLPIYYKRLFPYYLMCKWLGYSEVQRDYFHRREFSFTLKDDIYLRYLTFNDFNEFDKELQKRIPFKIDIGGVYTHQPSSSSGLNNTSSNVQFNSNNKVEERELVFDVDITDYDDVRYCCKGSSMCLKCWPLMKIAIKIIDKALQEDFGFEHRLWIYSGRRGIHCWVSDENARKLTQQLRSCIIDYLTLVKGGENVNKKVNFSSTSLHPSIKRAKQIINNEFIEYACNKQDFLSDSDKCNKLINLLPQECRQECSDVLSKYKTSTDKWKAFQLFIKTNKNKKLSNPHLIDEIQFQYVYPRLDIEVTKGLNHLLKSPFCIHPKTGRVCVPIDVDKLDLFNPFSVPTLSQLIGELDTCDMIVDDKKTKDYKRTNLASYIQVFEKFLNKLEKTWKGKNIELSDLKGLNGDF